MGPSGGVDDQRFGLLRAQEPSAKIRVPRTANPGTLCVCIQKSQQRNNPKPLNPWVVSGVRCLGLDFLLVCIYFESSYTSQEHATCRLNPCLPCASAQVQTRSLEDTSEEIDGKPLHEHRWRGQLGAGPRTFGGPVKRTRTCLGVRD